MAHFVKKTDSVLDYTLDWTKWLKTDGISTSVWTYTDGVNVISEDNNNKKTIILLGEMVVGSHKLTNKITTTDGLTHSYSFSIKVV